MKINDTFKHWSSDTLLVVVDIVNDIVELAFKDEPWRGSITVNMELWPDEVNGPFNPERWIKS